MELIIQGLFVAAIAIGIVWSACKLLVWIFNR
jgi:hypothetical protein